MLFEIFNILFKTFNPSSELFTVQRNKRLYNSNKFKGEQICYIYFNLLNASLYCSSEIKILDSEINSLAFFVGYIYCGILLINFMINSKYFLAYYKLLSLAYIFPISTNISIISSDYPV